MSMLDFATDRQEVVTDIAMPRTVSYSQLSTFRQCPGRWAAGRIVKQPDEWLSPLRLGSIVHAALEYAVDHPEVGNNPDWNRLCLKAIDEIRAHNKQQGWGDEPAPNVIKPNGQTATDTDWAKAAAEKLSGFRLPYALGRPLDPFATELKITTTVADIPLTGSVDYVDKSGAIVDWKTGKPSRDSSHADQVRLYTAMMETAGFQRPAAGFDVYVERSKSVEQDISPRAVQATVENMAGVYQEMSRQVARGVLDLIPSALCPWCPVANACPFARIQGAKAFQAARRSINQSDPRVRTHSTSQEQGADMSFIKTATESKTEPARDLWASAESLSKWGVDKTQPPVQAERAVTFGKPFQPTLLDGAINTASYGVSHVISDAQTVSQWCGKHDDWVEPVLDTLLKVEHETALAVWPEAVVTKDISTRDQLLMWLDSTLARDVGRIVVQGVNTDLAVESGTVDELISMIHKAGKHAQTALQAGVHILYQ